MKHHLLIHKLGYSWFRIKKNMKRKPSKVKTNPKFIVKRMKKSQNLLMEQKRLPALEDYAEAA